MNEPENQAPQAPAPPPSYRWPWFLAAGLLLGFVAAILWVGYAVHREKQERNFSAPLPVSSR